MQNSRAFRQALKNFLDTWKKLPIPTTHEIMLFDQLISGESVDYRYDGDLGCHEGSGILL